MALAAVGVFAGYTSATADTREPYLVARQDLALGHRITRSDLGTLPMDLPGLLRSKVYRDPAELVGAMVIGPVTKGELVQSSDVLSGVAVSDGHQLSFPIDSARAMNGQLRRGEFVNVLVTYGTGADGYTAAVVRGARVADRSGTSGTLSDRGDEVITLALPEAVDTLAVTHAINTGLVMLERVAGPAAAGDAETSPLVYRPGATPATDAATSPG